MVLLQLAEHVRHGLVFQQHTTGCTARGRWVNRGVAALASVAWGHRHGIMRQGRAVHRAAVVSFPVQQGKVASNLVALHTYQPYLPCPSTQPHQSLLPPQPHRQTQLPLQPPRPYLPHPPPLALPRQWGRVHQASPQQPAYLLLLAHQHKSEHRQPRQRTAANGSCAAGGTPSCYIQQSPCG